jgi:hypothetical protein
MGEMSLKLDGHQMNRKNRYQNEVLASIVHTYMDCVTTCSSFPALYTSMTGLVKGTGKRLYIVHHT